MRLYSIAEDLLLCLDPHTLRAAELVSKEWCRVISEGRLWKKLTERKVLKDPIWRTLCKRNDWIQYLFKYPKDNPLPPNSFYRSICMRISSDIEVTELNWRHGMFEYKRIQCNSQVERGVYCLQYDDTKIVCGLRDNTISIWDSRSLQCTKTLQGHTGSVLCLQFDDNVIISGSSDETIRVWDIHTGINVNTYTHHREPVLNLRFERNKLISCSKVSSMFVSQ